jgi:dihydrodipicolinate reductase
MAEMQLVVAGAGGRMGRTLIAAIAAMAGVTVTFLEDDHVRSEWELHEKGRRTELTVIDVRRKKS